MRGVVVHDEVDVDIGRDMRFHRVEEAAELGGPVPGETFADDPPGGDVERGEQRGRAMPGIVVRATLDLPRVHRQQGLGAVERLDLAFLVDAQDHRAVRWGHVQPDHIAHFRNEVGIGRQLEGLNPVWLQAEGPPDPLHRGRGQAARLGHAARAPMRAVGRQALEGSADHRLDPRVPDLARRARARLVAQPIHPVNRGATCRP